MVSYEKLKTARKNGRPTGGAYIEEIFEFPIELHGDRRFGDDLAIYGGLAYLEKRPVTFLAMEKGTDLPSRLARNFGCPKPEGYRKALRLMQQAENSTARSSALWIRSAPIREPMPRSVDRVRQSQRASWK